MNLTMWKETAKHTIEKIDKWEIVWVDKETVEAIRQRANEILDTNKELWD